jgi:oligopeptide transport system permease protein
MSAVLPLPVTQTASSGGVWSAAWTRFKTDKVGLVSLAIVAAFLLLVIAASLGLVAKNWQAEIGLPDAPPTFMGPAAKLASTAIAVPTGPNVDISSIDPLAPRYKEWDAGVAKYKTTTVVRSDTLPFGADRLGRDVVSKAIKGAQISIMVGLLAAVVATLIGTVLGAVGGFFGGKVGDLLEWVYNVFTSIPGILLIFTFAAVLNRADSIVPKGIWSIVIILGLTGWTGIYRLVRAEFIKHAVRDYVRSAQAIGASTFSRMFKHILPNVSYLGLGVAVDQVSWGTMLAEAQSELILGHWWQLVAATVLMAVFVTAFSLFTDALRDALDPKLRGLE